MIHGQSLGGGVTARLNSSDIQMIFCDRTFRGLYEASEHMVGRTLTRLFKIFSLWRWKMLTAESYLTYEGYKVTSCDPEGDTIIHELASLKSGVAHSVMEQNQVKLPSETKLHKLYNAIYDVV